jgi:hypothetical protein
MGAERVSLPNDVENRSFPGSVNLDNFNSAFASPASVRLAVESGELVIERYSMRLVPSVPQPPFKSKGLVLHLQPICWTEIRCHHERPTLPYALQERACARFR